MDNTNDVVSLDFIEVFVRDRQKVLFDEEIKALTSIDENGLFDVLPEHENFISIIKEKLIIHKKTGEIEEIKIGRGVLKVTKNKAYIYLVSDMVEEPQQTPSV